MNNNLNELIDAVKGVKRQLAYVAIDAARDAAQTVCDGERPERVAQARGVVIGALRALESVGGGASDVSRLARKARVACQLCLDGDVEGAAHKAVQALDLASQAADLRRYRQD